MVDAVNLCKDDGGPHTNGVRGRGHHGQTFVSDERDSVMEGLSLRGAGGISCCLQRHVPSRRTKGRGNSKLLSLPSQFTVRCHIISFAAE